MGNTDKYHDVDFTDYQSYINLTICGYLNITCCVIGSILNFFVIIVFTRKNMISPVNVIFRALAMSETMTMITYMPHTWHEFIRVQTCSVEEFRTLHWQLISLISRHVAFVLRCITVWLTVQLAIWRYLVVIYPLKGRKWCKMRNTRICIYLGYVCGILTWIPYSTLLNIIPVKRLVDRNGYVTLDRTPDKNIITIFETRRRLEYNLLYYKLHFMLQGLLCRIFPSILLTIISYR